MTGAVILLTLAACTKNEESGSAAEHAREGKSAEESAESTTAPVDVTFVDASKGLPTEGQWRERVAVADLDGDGQPEIIAPAARATAAEPEIWTRKEDAWIEWPTSFPQWSYRYGDVVAADFDRDGKIDLAFASHAVGIAVLLNQGDRSWKLSNEGLPAEKAFWTRALAVGDFDDDGWIDLAAIAEVSSMNATNPRGMRLYKNVEGRSWEERRIPALDVAHGASLLAANVDGEGPPELVVGSLESQVVDIVWKRESGGWNKLGGGFASPRIYWKIDGCPAGDEAPFELFVAEDTFGPEAPLGPAVYVLEEGEWKDRSEGLPSLRAISVAAGDFDRDGRCELASADIEDNVVRIYRRGGDGRWSEWQTFPPRDDELGGRVHSLTAADVDGDGHDDLIANYTSGEGHGGIRAWVTRP